MGFTSPTFVLLDLFPHLRLLTFCLASSLGIDLAILWLPARLYFNRRSALLLLQSSLASALQLATPAFEQSACRVTRKVLLFCVCWFSFDKAKKKTQKRKKRGKKNRTHGGHGLRALANQRPQNPNCAPGIFGLWSLDPSLHRWITTFRQVAGAAVTTITKSPKSDLFVYYPRLPFIFSAFLFCAWHLCLAVISHRVLSLPLHVSTLLFPFITLHAVPGVNHFFTSSLRFLIRFCRSNLFFFFFGSDMSTFLLRHFLLRSTRSSIRFFPLASRNLGSQFDLLRPRFHLNL